jgi:hypothetical protein
MRALVWDYGWGRRDQLDTGQRSTIVGHRLPPAGLDPVRRCPGIHEEVIPIFVFSFLFLFHWINATEICAASRRRRWRRQRMSPKEND